MSAVAGAVLLELLLDVLIGELISTIITELVQQWAGEPAGTIARWLVPILVNAFVLPLLERGVIADPAGTGPKSG